MPLTNMVFRMAPAERDPLPVSKVAKLQSCTKIWGGLTKKLCFQNKITLFSPPQSLCNFATLQLSDRTVYHHGRSSTPYTT